MLVEYFLLYKSFNKCSIIECHVDTVLNETTERFYGILQYFHNQYNCVLVQKNVIFFP